MGRIDVVGVVRCKNCERSYVISGRRYCTADGPFADCNVTDDFYCADGELGGATMAEYIDRAELIIGLQKYYESIYGRKPDFYNGYQIACGFVENFQTADVAPVRHGQWIRLDAVKGTETHKCSACKTASYVPTCMMAPIYEYCPNCGARMDGGVDDETD